MDISSLTPIEGVCRPPDRVEDKFGCSCSCERTSAPFQTTLLGLFEYPYSTNRPSPCCHWYAQPACLKFLAPNLTGNGNRNDGATSAPSAPNLTGNGNRNDGATSAPPLCTGNGNDGATSAQPTGNRKEGALAHVFHNGARIQA